MDDDLDRFLRTSLGQMNFQVDGIGANTPLGPAGLDVDSLARVEIAMRVDDDYGVRLSEEDITSIQELTVGQLLDLLRSRIRGAER